MAPVEEDRNEIVLGFTELIQRKIVAVHNLEMQKKLLVSHVSFCPMALFKSLDINNFGYLTVEEFCFYFGVDCSLNFEAIIEFLNISECPLTD